MRIQIHLSRLVVGIGLLSAFIGSVQASTVLKNTEAFSIIDDSDVTQNVELRFGESINEQLTWNRTTSRFEFTDDVHITGNLSASATLSGASITASGLQNCDSIDTDAAGTLICGTDNGISFTEASSWFINDAGDTMTGALTIQNTLSTTGNVDTQANLTINSDNGAADAVLTFGNDAGAETLRFSDANNRFEFTNSVHITGDLTTTGQINASQSATSGSVLISQTSGAPIWKEDQVSLVWYIDGDLSAAIEQGATVVLPFGMTVSDIDMHVKTAPTGADLIVDINENATSIYTTRPQISAGSSTEAGTESLADTTLAAGSEITVDIDQIGSSVAGSSLTIILHGVKKY